LDRFRRGVPVDDKESGSTNGLSHLPFQRAFAARVAPHILGDDRPLPVCESAAVQETPRRSSVAQAEVSPPAGFAIFARWYGNVHSLTL
jgi:hypothetical protein